MNYSALKSMLTDHLNRDDIVYQIDVFAELAVRKLEREKLYFLQTYTTLTTAGGISYVALPSDFVQENRMNAKYKSSLADSNGNFLAKIYSDLMISYQMGSAVYGPPCNYAIIGTNIELYPIPDAAYDLRLYYFKNLGLPGYNDSNAWTTTAYDVLFQATLVEAWDYLGNTDELIKAETKKERLLNSLRSISGKLTGAGQVRYMEI